PVSNNSKDVLQVFLDHLEKQHVELRLNEVVNEVLKEGDKITGVKLKNGDILNSRNVIITTGGRSVHQTESTADGFKYAKNLGHTVIQLFTTEVPILSDELLIKVEYLK